MTRRPRWRPGRTGCATMPRRLAAHYMGVHATLKLTPVKHGDTLRTRMYTGCCSVSIVTIVICLIIGILLVGRFSFCIFVLLLFLFSLGLEHTFDFPINLWCFQLHHLYLSLCILPRSCQLFHKDLCHILVCCFELSVF